MQLSEEASVGMSHAACIRESIYLLRCLLTSAASSLAIGKDLAEFWLVLSCSSTLRPNSGILLEICSSYSWYMRGPSSKSWKPAEGSADLCISACWWPLEVTGSVSRRSANQTHEERAPLNNVAYTLHSRPNPLWYEPPNSL